MFGTNFSIKTKNNFIAFVLSICFFNIISNQIAESQITQDIKKFPELRRKARTVTIFIHGSILKLPILWRASKGCPLGLKQYSEICDECNYKKVLRHLNEVDPNNYKTEDNYMFGWSGSLRGCQGEYASKELYDQIHELFENYKKKYGYIPNLRIITHSNGSRIALYLGKIAKQLNNKQFRVQELIMLACPVQYVTGKLIPQRAFRKIYSIYSLSDWVQIIAPQRYKKFKSKKNCKRCLSPFFSSRCFMDYPNLLQAKVRVNGHGISHSGFLRHKFIRKLPEVIDILDQQWGKDKPNCKTSGQCGVLVKV